jgi:hypothetical protein
MNTLFVEKFRFLKFESWLLTKNSKTKDNKKNLKITLIIIDEVPGTSLKDSCCDKFSFLQIG